MANQKRPTRPSGPQPRRLGNQSAPPRAGSPSKGAQRRAAAASRRGATRQRGFIAVGVVVLIVVVLVAVSLSRSNNGSTSAANTSAGRNPPAASAAIVSTITHVPQATFDSVGTGGQAPAFVVTKSQPALTSNGLPRFVYYGAEYCPYCALMRWSLITALSRFGTFQHLKSISSADSDGNIPTFSFLGATYKSKYLVFSPYEYEDRDENALQSVPSDVNDLFTRYVGSGSTASKFNASGTVGIPFLDIANKYVSSGTPYSLGVLFSNNGQPGVLVNGGPGISVIANAIAHPNTSVAKAISGSAFVAQANFITAGICGVTKNQPGSVCTTPGVRAAAKSLASVKPVG